MPATKQSPQSIHAERLAIIEQVRETEVPAVVATIRNPNNLMTARWKLAQKHLDLVFTREGDNIVCSPGGAQIVERERFLIQCGNGALEHMAGLDGKSDALALQVLEQLAHGEPYRCGMEGKIHTSECGPHEVLKRTTTQVTRRVS